MGGVGSGRPRKNANLRVMEGNRSRTPIPAPVVPGGAIFGPPDHLHDVVKRIWVELAAQTTVTAEVSAGFEVLCTMMAEFRSGVLSTTGRMVLRGLLNDFGMTTSSRERLGTKAPPAQDELERILQG